MCNIIIITNTIIDSTIPKSKANVDGLYTLYAHGSALNVKYGQEVKQGQTIMYVGSSGNSTGPHLHFEVRTSSSYSSRVNPLKYLP